MNAHWSQKLESMGACHEAVEYARTRPDLQTAWANCQRGDWMLWLLGRTDTDRRALVGCATDCAALALPIWQKHYPNDSRVADCLDACRKYARGEIDDAELRKYRSAAYAAATCAATCAAATCAAYAAYAAYADAAYAAYAAYAERTKVLAQCADIVRRHFPNAPELA